MMTTTTKMTGANIIGLAFSDRNGRSLYGVNPATGERLEPAYANASPEEVERACALAAQAAGDYARRSPKDRAAFLRRIAENLEGLGDVLIERADAETALGATRLTGERARTANQLRMFADLIEEGSWVDARIDTALPDRKPLPRPDLRRMLMPIGPVLVFGASNFPLAFSVCGGDTASALAAGCPVIVKAHSAHPGTSELAGLALMQAARECDMPEGVFSLLFGPGTQLGQALARDPRICAIGFTGSLRAGRALMDTAAARPVPIPVYTEMGSVNPVVLLPGALRERGNAIAEGLVQSVTLGVGQFCTNPGVVIAEDGPLLDAFLAKAAAAMATVKPATMLYDAICRSFHEGAQQFEKTPGVDVLARSTAPVEPGKAQAPGMLFATDAKTFLATERLREEVFGPSTIVVRCSGRDEMEQVARSWTGHLTATVHGTDAELADYAALIEILRDRVGRLLFNGFPTGVEVSPAMNHGGPYPAASSVRDTSVGTAAILRFVRPICYQNAPQSVLPEELQDSNPRGIWRLVDGQLTQAAL